MAQDTDEDVKKVVEQTVKETTLTVKVDQLDRSVGHVVSTARLGYGFLALFFSLFAIFSGIAISSFNNMWEDIAELRTTSANSSSALGELQEQLQLLQTTLGDAPAELQEASATLRQTVSELQEGTARLESVEAKLVDFGESALTLEEAVVGPKSVLQSDLNAIRQDIGYLTNKLIMEEPVPTEPEPASPR